MNQIRLCERVIWVDRGAIKKDGPTFDVVSAYEGSFTERIDVGDVQDRIFGTSQKQFGMETMQSCFSITVDG